MSTDTASPNAATSNGSSITSTAPDSDFNPTLAMKRLKDVQNYIDMLEDMLQKPNKESKEIRNNLLSYMETSGIKTMTIDNSEVQFKSRRNKVMIQDDAISLAHKRAKDVDEYSEWFDTIMPRKFNMREAVKLFPYEAIVEETTYISIKHPEPVTVDPGDDELPF